MLSKTNGVSIVAIKFGAMQWRENISLWQLPFNSSSSAERTFRAKLCISLAFNGQPQYNGNNGAAAG